jgi:hypothetical protein
MGAPLLTCLFHSGATVAGFLNSDAGRALCGDLLVECSLRPALGFALNLETPANYPGVAGLLGDVDLGALAHPTNRLPAPIVLAPGAGVAIGAWRAAIGCLTRPDQRVRAATLLVPVDGAEALGAALTICDRHAIAWDVAAAPQAELIGFARWLADERLFGPAQFAGLFPYAPGPIDPDHARRLRALLAPLAGASPRPDLIVTAG